MMRRRIITLPEHPISTPPARRTPSRGHASERTQPGPARARWAETPHASSLWVAQDASRTHSRRPLGIRRLVCHIHIARSVHREPRMVHSHLRIEHSPVGYRWLLLSRPERRNAIDLDLAQALRDALRQEETTPVVLASTDPRAFCAGADLNIPDADRATVSDLLYGCYEIMITRPGPVIAVINGPAVGGGAQL